MKRRRRKLKIIKISELEQRELRHIAKIQSKGQSLSWKQLAFLGRMQKQEQERALSPNVVQMDRRETKEQWLERMEILTRQRIEEQLSTAKGMALVSMAKQIQEQRRNIVVAENAKLKISFSTKGTEHKVTGS